MDPVRESFPFVNEVNSGSNPMSFVLCTQLELHPYDHSVCARDHEPRVDFNALPSIICDV